MGRLRKWVLPYYPYQGHQLPLYWCSSADPNQLGHDLNILEYGDNLHSSFLFMGKRTTRQSTSALPSCLMGGW